jgi:GNAT superfamily N-acetyltransferase
LNDYLQRQATQDTRRDVNRVFVARLEGNPDIVGYYSLSAASFGKRELPADRSRLLPHYPVPAALLGRLAVDKSRQGRGIGQHLMVDACWRVLQASEQLALYALIVDATDDEARAFYLHFGFIAFPDTPSRLFLPLATIRQALPAHR